jgi:tRNA (guanine10-N2)-dimethyltransferase
VAYAVELSGEHPKLARAEAAAAARAIGGAPVNADLERVQLALTIDPQAWADRLALAWRVIEVERKVPVDVDEIITVAEAIELEADTFAVRCSRLTEAHDAELAETIEREVGQALSDQADVDLDEPEAVVRVLLDNEAVVGVEAARIDRASHEERHVEERPDHSPVTLHPRLARALVNLTEVPEGGRLWDPFAGTGGLAVEAALIGADTLASDLDEEMVEATQSTLEHFEATGAVVQGDFQDVADAVGFVDGIATDPPYGRASKTHDEERQDLFERFLAVAAGSLDASGRLVVVLPDPELADLAPLTLDVVETFEWYVHGSLTRHIFVFERRAGH